jgi:hypothetical protein
MRRWTPAQNSAQGASLIHRTEILVQSEKQVRGIPSRARSLPNDRPLTPWVSESARCLPGASWATTPGVTSFGTPGLALYGADYFVVRARDLAGNEERNAVEKAGTYPCY